MTLLSVENLSVHGDAAQLVEPISLAMSSGQAVTLIGETGSGKSLFAQAILGTLPRGLRARGAMTVENAKLDVANPNALPICGVTRFRSCRKSRGERSTP